MKRTVFLVLCALITLSLSSCFFRKPTLEEYMKQNKGLYELIAQTGDEDEMEMEFTARGDDLVLTVRLKDKVNNVEAVSEAMSKATQEQRDVYLDMLHEVQKQVPSAESMIVEFYDASGVLLVYEQFK